MAQKQRHVTVEQLLARKRQLVEERDQQIERLRVGFDNAIAITEEYIQMAMAEAPDEEG